MVKSGFLTTVFFVICYSLNAISSSTSLEMVPITNADSTITFVSVNEFEKKQERAREIDSLDQLIAHSERKIKKAKKGMEESGPGVIIGLLALAFFWIMKRYTKKT